MPVLNDQPILIVEDSPEDFEMTKRSLSAAGVRNSIQWCTDGDEALEYLEQFKQGGDAATSPNPGFILLDLNLPGTDGRGVLAELQEDEVLSQIPVVVLSTSMQVSDIKACYDLGASEYISKPLNAKDFVDVMIRLKHTWFEEDPNQPVGVQS